MCKRLKIGFLPHNIYLENSGVLHMARCWVSGFIHERISVLLGLLDPEDEGTIFL
jgi:hypothetical protein